MIVLFVLNILFFDMFVIVMFALNILYFRYVYDCTV